MKRRLFHFIPIDSRAPPARSALRATSHASRVIDSVPPHGTSPFGHVATLLSKPPTSLQQFFKIPLLFIRVHLRPFAVQYIHFSFLLSVFSFYFLMLFLRAPLRPSRLLDLP
jgi:hypothetical protein